MVKRRSWAGAAVVRAHMEGDAARRDYARFHQRLRVVLFSTSQIKQTKLTSGSRLEVRSTTTHTVGNVQPAERNPFRAPKSAAWLRELIAETSMSLMMNLWHWRNQNQNINCFSPNQMTECCSFFQFSSGCFNLKYQFIGDLLSPPPPHSFSGKCFQSCIWAFGRWVTNA